MSASALTSLLLADPDAVRALEAVRAVGPKHAYIAAGFIRNRVWDSLYDPRPEAESSDIDVVYFDAGVTDPAVDEAFEAALRAHTTGDWQVRNQARMHLRAGDRPYRDLADALSRWPETATAIAARLNEKGDLDLVAPFGLDDLMAHVARPSPAILARDPAIFTGRLAEKGWQARWPRLSVRLPRR